jgi:hypothetical protein
MRLLEVVLKLYLHFEAKEMQLSSTYKFIITTTYFTQFYLPICALNDVECSSDYIASSNRMVSE